MKAEPQIKLHSFTKADWTELKSLASPPQEVKIIFDMVAAMFNMNDFTWASHKKNLFKDYKVFQNYDAAFMSQDAINNVKAKLAEHPEITVESITKKSKAAAAALKWVHEALEHHK